LGCAAPGAAGARHWDSAGSPAAGPALGLPVWPQALRACGRAAARTAAGRVLTPVCVARGAWDGARGAALAPGWR
jgi:hypothetical protein